VPWKGRLQFFNVPKHALEARSDDQR
jgi:hypothetical protein